MCETKGWEDMDQLLKRYIRKLDNEAVRIEVAIQNVRSNDSFSERTQDELLRGYYDQLMLLLERYSAAWELSEIVWTAFNDEDCLSEFGLPSPEEE